MFNQDESRKFWKYTGYGAAVGAGLCVALFVYELFAEAWNCLCDCFGGCDSLPEVNSWLTFLFVFLISTGIGFMVGLFSALSDRSVRLADEASKRAAATSEEARKQRIKWAGEVKQKALSVANTCEKNAKEYKALIAPNYKSDSQMDAIIKELANAAELKGKVDAMANDTKTKGGASK